MDLAKIQLSASELDLVTNSEWLLTKNSIIEKVYQLFGRLAQRWQHDVARAPVVFPAEVLTHSPKISRGENYKGLPYVMLDYPRCFGKMDVCAIRTFFWWGHFFSVTLHLKGTYLQHFWPALQANGPLLRDHQFLEAMGEDEWQHDLGSAQYRKPEGSTFPSSKSIPTDMAFCKYSSGIALQQWNEAESELGRLYQVLLRSLELPS